MKLRLENEEQSEPIITLSLHRSGLGDGCVLLGYLNEEATNKYAICKVTDDGIVKVNTGGIRYLGLKVSGE